MADAAGRCGTGFSGATLAASIGILAVVPFRGALRKPIPPEGKVLSGERRTTVYSCSPLRIRAPSPKNVTPPIQINSSAVSIADVSIGTSRVEGHDDEDEIQRQADHTTGEEQQFEQKLHDLS